MDRRRPQQLWNPTRRRHHASPPKLPSFRSAFFGASYRGAALTTANLFYTPVELTKQAATSWPDACNSAPAHAWNRKGMSWEVDVLTIFHVGTMQMMRIIHVGAARPLLIGGQWTSNYCKPKKYPVSRRQPRKYLDGNRYAAYQETYEEMANLSGMI